MLKQVMFSCTGTSGVFYFEWDDGTKSKVDTISEALEIVLGRSLIEIMAVHKAMKEVEVWCKVQAQ